MLPWKKNRVGFTLPRGGRSMEFSRKRVPRVGRAVRRISWLALALLITASSQPARAGERVFRVVTYNVWGLVRPFLKKPRRFQEIARTIPELDADVIAFQETFSKKTRILSTLKGYPYVARGPGKTGLKIQGSGLLLVSRWPIVESETLVYEACAFPSCLEAKGALFVRVLVDGLGEVDVYDTHLIAGDFEAARAYQAHELAAVIERKSAGRPVVVVGDFNAEPETLGYRVFKDRLRLRNAHEDYVAAHPELPEFERLGYTFDPLRNRNIRAISPSKKRHRIDHVWVRPEAGPVRAKTELCNLIYDEPIAGMFLSDHFGLLADIRFQTPEPPQASAPR